MSVLHCIHVTALTRTVKCARMSYVLRDALISSSQLRKPSVGNTALHTSSYDADTRVTGLCMLLVSQYVACYCSMCLNGQTNELLLVHLQQKIQMFHMYGVVRAKSNVGHDSLRPGAAKLAALPLHMFGNVPCPDP